MKETNALAEMESLFLALSDKTRLRILNLMRDGEVCVNNFTEVLGESQPKISRHLAYLKNAGIVSARRDGKWIYYKFEIPESISAENILHDALEWLKMQKDMREDCVSLARLSNSSPTPKTDFEESSSNISASANIRTNVREELETFLL